MLGTYRVGLRGDQIPSAGTHGPAAGYPSLNLPAQSTALVRFEITAAPASGVLAMWEDTSFQLVGAGAGSYSLTGNQHHDDVLYGVVTHTIVIT